MARCAFYCWLVVVFCACGGDDAGNPIGSGASNELGPVGELKFRTMGCCVSAITTGDFDGDGDVDIAALRMADETVNSIFPTLSVFHNRSGEGFGASTQLGISVDDRGTLATSDLNGDGADDLVVGGYSRSDLTLRILMADGQGGFSDEVKMSDGRDSGGVRALQIIDINGDGERDIIHTGGDGFSITPNRGGGTFGSPIHMNLGFIAATTMVVGDIATPIDGRPDVFVLGSFDRFAIVRMASDFEVVETVRGQDENLVDEYKGLAAADYDRDGDVEVVMSSETGNDVLYFETGTRHPAGPRPLDIVTADFDGDGTPDVATVNYGDDTVSIVRATGDGGFHVPQRKPVGESPISLEVGDFDGNGALDLVVLNEAGQPQERPDYIPAETFDMMAITGSAYVVLNPGL